MGQRQVRRSPGGVAGGVPSRRFPQGMGWGCCERFDSIGISPYTSLFVREGFFPEWGGSKWFGVVELEGKYLRSRNKVRRNGTEERPEWGASPAKPSEPLRTEAKRVVLLLGVRTEFLAGGISGFAVDLSALECALAPFCVRALREPRKFLRAIAGRSAAGRKRGTTVPTFSQLVRMGREAVRVKTK